MRKYFFISSLAFFALIIAAIYQDSNPEWKIHQRRFKKLHVANIQKQYEETLRYFQKPEVESERQLLKEKHEKALEEFKKPAAQKLYRTIRKEHKKLSKELGTVRDSFQKARIGFQRLEQKFISSPEADKKKWQEKLSLQKNEITTLEDKEKGLRQQAAALEENIRALKEPVEKAERELVQFLSRKNDLERNRKLARSQRMEIKQVVNVSLGIVDRCQSCHLEIGHKDSGLLETHPPEKFGCAICHGGQGRATNAQEAHGHLEYGSAPLIERSYLESSCAKCHTGPKPPDAPNLQIGRKLFLAAGCLGCHAHKDYGKIPKIGPDLTSIGAKVQYGWLKKWLKRPKDYLPKTLMPDFSLSEKEVEAIGAFLMTLTNERPRTYSRTVGNPELGEKIFKESHCISCHLVNDRGGKLAPDLGKVASKIKRGYLIEYLRNPRQFQPETKMPRYRFSEQELQGLAEYLLMEFQDFDAFDESRGATPPVSPSLIEEGKRLTRHYGCYGCHNIPGINGAEIGAELTEIGLKRREHLDFGLLSVSPRQKNLTHWLSLKLKTPRAFRDTLKMPSYDFSDEEIGSLVTVLMSFANHKKPEMEPLKKREDYKSTPTGEFGKLLKDFNCLVCHSIQGQGGDIAPDISLVGSQVQAQWLFNFLLNPDTIRLSLIERMPKFRFLPSEAKALSQYIQLFLVDDEISHLSQTYYSWKGSASAGKKLYFRYGCHACHQIGSEGGSIGPELTHVGNRLTPGWIFSWLKNPQKFRPDALEPNRGFSDEEVAALTAFLSSLK